MKMRKNGKGRQFDIPEISRDAVLRPLRHRPAKGASLSQENITLGLESHVLSWFRLEAERQKKSVDTFINEALRQYMIAQVGDADFQSGGLNATQRTEVVMLINKVLSPQKRTHKLPIY